MKQPFEVHEQGSNRLVEQLQPGPALPARVNYISRSTSATYQLHSSVRWHNTYPGVDLIFRDNPDHFEYDVELAPGAGLAPVALAFDGVDNIRIDQRTGDLILTAAGRAIRESKPVAYQLNAGVRTPIDVTYQLDPNHHVRFRAARYDTKLALIIDPQLIFEHVINTTAGASDATAIALDPQGNIYTAGHTLDPNFPHTGSSTFHGLGQYDSYVAKWTPRRQPAHLRNVHRWNPQRIYECPCRRHLRRRLYRRQHYFTGFPRHCRWRRHLACLAGVVQL